MAILFSPFIPIPFTPCSPRPPRQPAKVPPPPGSPPFPSLNRTKSLPAPAARLLPTADLRAPISAPLLLRSSLPRSLSRPRPTPFFQPLSLPNPLVSKSSIYFLPPLHAMFSLFQFQNLFVRLAPLQLALAPATPSLRVVVLALILILPDSPWRLLVPATRFPGSGCALFSGRWKPN